MKVDLIISESEEFISITVCVPTEDSLSWESLQEIKDEHYPELEFIEVYPKKENIINNANERHLIHVKKWNCPNMWDLEQDSITKFSSKIIGKNTGNLVS